MVSMRRKLKKNIYIYTFGSRDRRRDVDNPGGRGGAARGRGRAGPDGKGGLDPARGGWHDEPRAFDRDDCPGGWHHATVILKQSEDTIDAIKWNLNEQYQHIL